MKSVLQAYFFSVVIRQYFKQPMTAGKTVSQMTTDSQHRESWAEMLTHRCVTKSLCQLELFLG